MIKHRLLLNRDKQADASRDCYLTLDVIVLSREKESQELEERLLECDGNDLLNTTGFHSTRIDMMVAG